MSNGLERCLGVSHSVFYLEELEEYLGGERGDAEVTEALLFPVAREQIIGGAAFARFGDERVFRIVSACLQGGLQSRMPRRAHVDALEACEQRILQIGGVLHLVEPLDSSGLHSCGHACGATGSMASPLMYVIR